MKKLIIFDAMGVIYKTSDDVKYLLYPFLKELDAGLTFKRTNGLYMKLSLGEITSGELFSSLGFGAQYPKIEKEYLDSRLLLDKGFIPAAERLSERCDLAMLSNDAAEWVGIPAQKNSVWINIFTVSVISGGVGVRKPLAGNI